MTKKTKKEDDILREIRENPESANVLYAVIQGLGEEQASIKEARIKAEREGDDVTRIAARRVQALRAVAETWIRRADQVSKNVVDLDSPGFVALWTFITETLKVAMVSAHLRPEQVEAVFSKLSSLLTDEWKDEARTRMKNQI